MGKAKFYLLYASFDHKEIMKILTIGNITKGVNWDKLDDVLKIEAKKVYQLYLEEYIREIYFTDTADVIIILECVNKKEAQKLLNTLPLVKEKILHFTLYELSPYSGFSRLMNN